MFHANALKNQFDNNIVGCCDLWEERLGLLGCSDVVQCEPRKRSHITYKWVSVFDGPLIEEWRRKKNAEERELVFFLTATAVSSQKENHTVLVALAFGKRGGTVKVKFRTIIFSWYVTSIFLIVFINILVRSVYFQSTT